MERAAVMGHVRNLGERLMMVVDRAWVDVMLAAMIGMTVEKNMIVVVHNNIFSSALEVCLLLDIVVVDGNDSNIVVVSCIVP